MVLGQKGRLALDLMVEKVQYFLLYAVVISVVDCVDCTIILWVSLNMVVFWDLDLIGLSHRFPKPYLRPVWSHLQFIRIELKGSYFSHKVGLYLFLFFYLFTTIIWCKLRERTFGFILLNFFSFNGGLMTRHLPNGWARVLKFISGSTISWSCPMKKASFTTFCRKLCSKTRTSSRISWELFLLSSFLHAVVLSPNCAFQPTNFFSSVEPRVVAKPC